MIQGIPATIYVSDMSRAVDFYTNTLGLPLAGRWGDEYASIDLGKGAALGLHPAKGPHSPKPGARGAIQVGLAVSKPLDDVVKDLQAKGVVFRSRVVDDAQVRLPFFGGPAGNELQRIEVEKRR